MDRNVNIITELDGKKIVLINDIRFKAKKREDWKDVEEYLKEYVEEFYEIAETSEKIFISTDFPDEMVAKPIILNSDQGCQFTSNEYMNFLKENQIRQSMDGKSRWADNIMIERWFRSFKYEEAYLTQYNNIREARKAIGKYVHTYNFERCHSALNNQTPASCYYPIPLLDDHAA